MKEDAVSTPSAIAFLRDLRATREFTDEPVSQAALDDIIEVARWSGSASNRQLWDLVVVRDRSTLRALAKLEGSAAHLDGAAAGIVIANAGLRPQQAIFDEGRLAERIMLAAHAHGLGSCIGWLRESGRDDAKRMLGIPEDRFVRTVISVGRPAGRRGGKRKHAAELAHFERF